MVLGKLRVETQETIHNNPYYGTYVCKKVTENEYQFEKHEKVPFPPCGILGEIKIGDIIMHIEINKYFFEYIEDERFETIFCVDGKMFSISIKFNNDEIEYVELYVWNSKGDFEDDEDPDNHYNIKDFTKIEKYVC